MSDIRLSPGNIRVVSVRAQLFFRGIPVFDCELDPDNVQVPSGKVTLTINGVSISATVDPRGSGQFVDFVHVRLIAGCAGWDKIVSARHYHSDSGVSSREVIQTTAQETGETANVSTLVTYAADFMRSKGPASRVLNAFPWWVDLQGVTQVGTRPTIQPDASVQLLRYDPTMQLAELASDGLVLPGTVITDARLPAGPITVRDTDQTFDGQGSKVMAWCGPSDVAQFVNDLKSLVEEMSQRTFLQTYLYQVFEEGSDNRLQLQIVSKADGLPDTLPLSPWGGPGDSAKLRPGSRVRVAFFAGDPSQPIADSYEPGVLPLERTVDAEAIMHVGPSAALVELAKGPIPIALAPPITTFFSALQTWSAAVAGALSTAGFPIAGPQAALVAAIGTASSNTPATKVTAQ